MAVGSCAALLLLTTMGVGAATSDVADAVMRGDSAAVRRLLTQKADVNAPQADGATALHWAVYRDDLATVDLLLKAGANAKAANSFGATPLSLAAENGNPAIVKRLLDAGADANERMAQQRHRAHDGGPDRQRRDDEAAARSRRRRERERNGAGHDGVDVGGGSATSGGRPAARRPRSGRQRALEPRLAGPARELRQSLRSETFEEAGQRQVVSQIGPRNMRGTDGGGLTPLVFAARANDLESVRILLAAGADVNQVTQLRVEPAARRDAESVLPARRPFCSTTVPIRTSPTRVPGRRSISRSITAISKEGIIRSARRTWITLEFIKKLIDKGAERQLASQGVDVVPDGVHVAVGARGWRDRLLARVPVERSRRDEAAARTRRRSEHRHDHQCHPAAGRGRHRLGGRRHVRMVEGSQHRGRETAAEPGQRPERAGRDRTTALHGAGHKGRTEVIQVLVDAGAKLDMRDYGMNGNDAGGRLREHTWLPVDYADGLIRIGTQSAIIQPEAGALLRKLMTERGMPAPPAGRTLESVCAGSRTL